MEFNKITESDSNHNNLELKTTKDLVNIINSEDMTVAKSVVSNMSQSYLENIQCMHALSSSIIDTVPCKRNIEDNLHIKDSYEFISSMRSRSLFDFDIEKQDEALADAFSEELGGLPKLLRGELPKLKQFVTTN